MDEGSNEGLKPPPQPEQKNSRWSGLKKALKFKRDAQEKPIAGSSQPEILDPQSGYAALVNQFKVNEETKDAAEILEKRYSQFIDYIDNGELGMNSEYINPEKRKLIKESFIGGDIQVIAKIARQRIEQAQRLVSAKHGDGQDWDAKVKAEKNAMRAILQPLLRGTEYQGKEMAIYSESWMKFLPQSASV
jgi:hypothetical protein